MKTTPDFLIKLFRVDSNLSNFHCCNLILTSNKAENSIFGFSRCELLSYDKNITFGERKQCTLKRWSFIHMQMSELIKSRPAKCKQNVMSQKARIKQSWQFHIAGLFKALAKRNCWKMCVCVFVQLWKTDVAKIWTGTAHASRQSWWLYEVINLSKQICFVSCYENGHTWEPNKNYCHSRWTWGQEVITRIS